MWKTCQFGSLNITLTLKLTISSGSSTPANAQSNILLTVQVVFPVHSPDATAGAVKLAQLRPISPGGMRSRPSAASSSSIIFSPRSDGFVREIVRYTKVQRQGIHIRQGC